MARRELGPATLAVAQAVDAALTETTPTCSSPAPAGPTRWRWPSARSGRRPPHSRPTHRGGRRPRSAAGVGGGGRAGPGPARPASASPTCVVVLGADRCRPAGTGGRRSRTPGTRPCDAEAAAAGRDHLARPHPGRPGRDRAARAGPRLRPPLPGRHGRPRRPAGPAAARTAPGGDRAGLRRARAGPVARPAQRRPRGSPAYASAAMCCPRWRPSSGPGMAEALARTAALARDDADLLDALAADADPGTDTLDCAELLALPAALRTPGDPPLAAPARRGRGHRQHVAVGRRAGHPLARAGRNSPARCQSHPSGWEPALPA